MNILFKPIMISGMLILFDHAISRDPARLCNPADSICITGVVEFPQNEGPHPAVVLLHGAAGWHTKYALLAGLLADSGFVALALDYYADVGSSTIGSEGKLMIGEPTLPVLGIQLAMIPGNGAPIEFLDLKNKFRGY